MQISSKYEPRKYPKSSNGTFTNTNRQGIASCFQKGTVHFYSSKTKKLERFEILAGRPPENTDLIGGIYPKCLLKTQTIPKWLI